MSIRKNTGYNLAGRLLPLVATFITLPLYLEAIGEARYGLLAVLWTLLGYFGLFDLGLGRAAANRIAALRAATVEERATLFWTVATLTLVLGCLGGLALWGSGRLLISELIEVPAGLSAEVALTLPYLAAAVPLVLVSSVLTGVLTGRERFLANNAVQVLDATLSQVVPLVVAAAAGPELWRLVPAVLGVRLLATIGRFALCFAFVPLRGAPRVDRRLLRPLFAYGGWVSVSSVVGPLLVSLDRIVIGAVVGARAVAHYTVPWSLAVRIGVIPAGLSSALFPRFSAQKESDNDALAMLAVHSLLVIVTPLIIGGMLIMEPFLVWWVGSEFAAQSATAGEIIVLGLWLNGLASIPYASLQAQGKPDIVAKIHLAEAVPYVLVLWWLVTQFGIVGAAIATSLQNGVDAGLLFTASRIRVKSYGPALEAALLVLTSGMIALFLPPSNLRWLASLLLVVGSAWWALKNAPHPVRDMLRRVPLVRWLAAV